MQVKRYGLYSASGECIGTCESEEAANKFVKEHEDATIVILTGNLVPKRNKKKIMIEIPVMEINGNECIDQIGSYHVQCNPGLRFTPRGFSRWAQAEVEIEVSGAQ